MWVPISQERVLLLRDTHYDELVSIVVTEELGPALEDGTKYFKYRYMVWKFKVSGLPCLAVMTVDNRNYFYKWEDENATMEV